MPSVFLSGPPCLLTKQTCLHPSGPVTCLAQSPTGARATRPVSADQVPFPLPAHDNVSGVLDSLSGYHSFQSRPWAGRPCEPHQYLETG